ncbi:MAG: hypothetical protein WEB30_09725 [Cyclobacteriaceae bacterium]
MQKVIPVSLIIVSGLFISCGCTQPYVKLTDENASYGDLDGHLKIETSNATYFFRKAGGGFSGIIDKEGKDWISHSDAPKSSGMWRGIPNTNVPGWRPEQSGTETRVILQEDDKIVISCEKNNYRCTWTFYPEYATMNVIEADSNYYFSYEGAPNGKFDTTSNYFFRPDKQIRHFLDKPSDETDIKAQPSENWEWCYFSDTNTKKALFFIHHEDDVFPDYYRPLPDMTVFGFGRTGNADENLTEVPQSFTIGFSSDTTFQVVSDKVRDIVEQPRN